MAIVITLSQVACEDLLTRPPRSTLTTENFFRTEAEVVAALAAAYAPLSEADLYGTGYKSALVTAADDANVGPLEETPSIIAIDRLTWDAQTERVVRPWNGWYTIIGRTNLILEKLPQTAMPEERKPALAGEAKFLRALAYFNLVRIYGDVPLVVTTAEQLGLPARTPKEEVFAQIQADARDAEAALPLSWTNTNKGRATQGAAQALLAEMHLWRSSAEGKDEWQQAADAARKIVESGVYAMTEDYIDAFLPGSQMRSEEIFAAQATGSPGPRVRTADMFFPREMVPNQAGGWGAMIPADWALESYAEGDERYDATYFTTGRTSTGTEVTFAPHVYKYRPTGRPNTRDANWPIYRYAEVLLFYAEALNELGQTAEAVEFLNMVRERASAPPYTSSLDQTLVRDSIFDERRIETAFEGDRWFDLVRRGSDWFQDRMSRDPGATDVQVTDMLWPIPQLEIEVNTNLTQNPGY